MMSRAVLFALLCTPLVCASGSWRTAAPGWQYAFPRDHHAHTEFKTEWWYFTGNLADADGKRFGFELTFFREGVQPPESRDPQLSRFVVNDLKFAHFAVTDGARKQFMFDQKVSRGAFGEAGFGEADRLAWIEDWSLKFLGEGAFELRAQNAKAAIHLTLRSSKPPAIHGSDGVSQKAAGEGNASHYYSLTRLGTAGEIVIEGKTMKATGESWFDHEWATNQLAANQVGWDWLSVQLADGRELMLYRMRLADGSVDAESSGTLVDANGATTHLTSRDFQLEPTRFWKNAGSGASYPVEWRVHVASAGLQFSVRPLIDAQELALKPLNYWEGAIETIDARNANMGRGYLELTGYSEPLRLLTR